MIDMEGRAIQGGGRRAPCGGPEPWTPAPHRRCGESAGAFGGREAGDAGGRGARAVGRGSAGRVPADGAAPKPDRPIGLPHAASCIMTPMKKRVRIDQVLARLRVIKPGLESRYQVDELALFGSFTTGRNRPRSDLDVLVSFREPPSLLRFIELENELSDELGVKVDLVMREALKPRIGARILKEVVPV